MKARVYNIDSPIEECLLDIPEGVSDYILADPVLARRTVGELLYLKTGEWVESFEYSLEAS